MGSPLPVVILALTVIAIVSAVILVRAAFVRPRIGALVERAAIAVVIAVFGSIYSMVAINTELGQTLFSTDIGRLIVRLIVIALLAIPAYWTALYLTGRLGDGS